MSIFQSKEWKEFKLGTGYQKSYWIDNILILQKNLPFGYSMLYSPMVGSEAASILNNELRIKEFIGKISTIGKTNKTIFFRLELDIPSDHNSQFTIHNSAFGFVKAFEEMQPEHTWVLDLTKTDEELLAGMKQKGRYNIKIAGENEVEIAVSDTLGSELDDFYRLYSATGKRHHIPHRAQSYFSSLLEILGKSGYARVYTAYKRINGKKIPLASAIVVYSGKTAIYMFGSSSDEYKNLMAPYTLHWKIIQDAKERGFEQYDFFGIAPDDNPSHPWAGITRFKKQFGGEQIDIMGSYDLIFKPFQYQLFKIAEKIRRK